MRSPIYTRAILAIVLMSGSTVAAAGIGIFAFVAMIDLIPRFVQRETETLESIQRLSSDARALVSVAPRYASVESSFDLGTLNGRVADQIRLLNETMTELSQGYPKDFAKQIGAVRDSQDRLVGGLEEMNQIALQRLDVRLRLRKGRHLANSLVPQIQCALASASVFDVKNDCDTPVSSAGDDVDVVRWLIEAGGTTASLRNAMIAENDVNFRKALSAARMSAARVEAIEATLTPRQVESLMSVRSDFRTLFADGSSMFEDLANERALRRQLDGTFNQSNFDASRFIAAMATLVLNVTETIRAQERQLTSRLETLTTFLAVLMALCVIVAVFGFLFFRERVIARLLALRTAVQAGVSDAAYAPRLETDAEDEIGDIARAYDRVLGEVQVREDRLRHERDRAKDLAQEADDANRAKSNFLSHMSHELRTPLNAIIGFSQLLQMKDVTSSQIEDYSRDILGSGRHLLSVLNEILELSKIEAERVDLDVERVSAARIFDDALKLMKPQILEKSITVERNIDRVEFDGDAFAMQRVLANLLSNAVKFSDEEGRIRVEAHYDETGRSAELLVIDEGCGIDNEALETILEPFRQEDDHYVSTAGGIGLGLAIVDGIVKLHGGTVSIESEKNKGTTVTVSLPVTASRDVRVDAAQ